MPKAAFCGLRHSASDVYFVKSSTFSGRAEQKYRSGSRSCQDDYGQDDESQFHCPDKNRPDDNAIRREHIF